MSTAMDRPRIRTVNEQFGSGFLDESQSGGVWMVKTMMLRNVCHLFSNRQAAEDYIYQQARTDGRPTDYWEIEVWAVDDTWPTEDAE